MSDNHTPIQRSANMAAIKGKDTKPEMVVRRFLWIRGFRYRLNHKRLPGKPDIVLRRYRTCIFVNGCFWHGHNVEVQDGSNAALVQGVLRQGSGEQSSEQDAALVQESSNALLVQEGSNASLVQDGSNASLVQSSDCCKIPKSNTPFWV